MPRSQQKLAALTVAVVVVAAAFVASAPGVLAQRGPNAGNQPGNGGAGNAPDRGPPADRGPSEKPPDRGPPADRGPSEKPPGDVAAFQSTTPLMENQTTPDSLAGKIRVEEQYAENTTVELQRDTSTEYTLEITVTGDAENVTFFLQERAVSSSQNIENVTMYLDGEANNFTVDQGAGPGNSPWILFEVPHFSTRTITFSSADQTVTVAQSIAGSDDRVDTDEMLAAIDLWANGTAVPDTGGRTVDTSTVLSLIGKWATGATV